MTLLSKLKDYLKFKNNDYTINSHYSICTTPNFNVGIYFQGYSQKTHGFTEGTIADLSGRVKKILQDIKSKNLGACYV